LSIFLGRIGFGAFDNDTILLNFFFVFTPLCNNNQSPLILHTNALQCWLLLIGCCLLLFIFVVVVVVVCDGRVLVVGSGVVLFLVVGVC